MSSTTIVAAAEFKAKCLQLMDRVAATGESIVITKHGRPVAMLVTASAPKRSPFGFAKHMITYVGDIMSPAIDESDWEPDEEELRLIAPAPKPAVRKKAR